MTTSPNPIEQSDVTVSSADDTITIYGIRYSGAFFRRNAFANIGTLMQITKREDGVVTTIDLNAPDAPI